MFGYKINSYCVGGHASISNISRKAATRGGDECCGYLLLIKYPSTVCSNEYPQQNYIARLIPSDCGKLDVLERRLLCALIIITFRDTLETYLGL